MFVVPNAFGYFQPLHPTLYILHPKKIAPKCDFSCKFQKKVVPLHPNQSHLAMPTNLFQHITTSNDIRQLCNKQGVSVAANYTLLAIKGWADIEYNHVPYHLTPQMVLFGSFAAEIKVLSLSNDWQCNIIINPSTRLDETIYSCLQIEKEWHKKIQFLQAHPVQTISTSVREHMQQYYNILLSHTELDNIYHQRIQYLLRQSAIFELLAWIDEQMRSTPVNSPASDRKHQLMLEFMRLLQETKGRERSASWYAEKLCITTKYLQAICRNTVQSTPTDIIDKIAIAEIKSLLSNTNMSVKEVASDMCFSSASSFCKYFHRLTGMSALSYREQR